MTYHISKGRGMEQQECGRNYKRFHFPGSICAQGRSGEWGRQSFVTCQRTQRTCDPVLIPPVIFRTYSSSPSCCLRPVSAVFSTPLPPSLLHWRNKDNRSRQSPWLSLKLLLTCEAPDPSHSISWDTPPMMHVRNNAAAIIKVRTGTNPPDSGARLYKPRCARVITAVADVREMGDPEKRLG